MFEQQAHQLGEKHTNTKETFMGHSSMELRNPIIWDEDSVEQTTDNQSIADQPTTELKNLIIWGEDSAEQRMEDQSRVNQSGIELKSPILWLDDSLEEITEEQLMSAGLALEHGEMGCCIDSQVQQTVACPTNIEPRFLIETKTPGPMKPVGGSNMGCNILGNIGELTPFHNTAQDIEGCQEVQLSILIDKGKNTTAVSPFITPSQNQPIVMQGKVLDLKRPKIDSYAAAQMLINNVDIVAIKNAIYYFDGRVYKLMRKDDIRRLIMDKLRSVIAIDGTPHFIENVYAFLRAEPQICNDGLVPSPDEVVFSHGILNLQTEEFGPPYQGFFATSYLKASYWRGIKMQCPVFDKFISDISHGNVFLTQRIWETMGYCLTQDQRGKCFILLQGPSDSGKSILGNFLRGCYSKEMVSSLDVKAFAEEFSLADLIGKGLCIDLDLPAGSINAKAISVLKKITGGDLLSTNIKYLDRVSFMNTAKIVFASNHAVISTTKDDAFLKRLVVVPFLYSVPKEAQDRCLGEKVAAISRPIWR